MARGGRWQPGHEGGGPLTSPQLAPRFRYERAASLDDAARLLSLPGAVALGGGTDLLPAIDDGLIAPTAVVDLTGLRGADAIERLPDGSVTIGAAAAIADITAHPDIVARFPALAQACAAVGSPALRNMGTIGGNLCQRPRCWYLRRAIPCLKNGGDHCPAKDGENQYHAILDGGPCYIVHPSDPAVALLALDAHVEIAGGGVSRTVSLEEFYVLPRQRLDHETVLQPGEFVASVIVPGESAGGRGGRQLYRKLMQREAWDFALASIAAVRREDGTVRMALGGVAPRPWRVPSSVEEDVASGELDDESIAALAERALYDAEPLAKNAYKVELAASLIRDAIVAIQQR